jgi:hypothetical protein
MSKFSEGQKCHSKNRFFFFFFKGCRRIDHQFHEGFFSLGTLFDLVSLSASSQA